MAERWPDFFVVGAGKSGTTTLYNVLKQHADVFLPDNKEPFYFNDRTIHHKGEQISRDKYLSLYKNATHEQLVGDFSTSYFICPNAPRRISQTNPHAKIIILLRDPIERSYSDYLMLKTRGQISNDFLKELSSEIERVKKNLVQWPFIIRTSLYHSNITRFLDHFDAKNIFIGYTSDLKNNPQQFYQSIYNFLGLAEVVLNTSALNKKSNPYSRVRSKTLGTVLFNAKVISSLRLVVPLRARKFLKNSRNKLVFTPTEKPAMPDESYSILAPIFMNELIALRKQIGEKVMQLAKNWPTL